MRKPTKSAVAKAISAADGRYVSRARLVNVRGSVSSHKMTVKELRKLLKAYPKRANVEIDSFDGHYGTILSVYDSEDGKTVYIDVE